MKALLIIDMQDQAKDKYHKDYIKEDVTNSILKAIKLCNAKNLPVIHVLTEYTDKLMPLLNKQKGYKFFMKGSPEAKEVDAISKTYSKNHYKIIKHHYDSFYKTKLNSLLKKLNVDTLIITGIYTHWCVLSTVFSAMSRDYNITIIKEGISSRYPVLQEQIITNILNKNTDALKVVSVENLEL